MEQNIPKKNVPRNSENEEARRNTSEPADGHSSSIFVTERNYNELLALGMCTSCNQDGETALATQPKNELLSGLPQGEISQSITIPDVNDQLEEPTKMVEIESIMIPDVNDQLEEPTTTMVEIEIQKVKSVGTQTDEPTGSTIMGRSTQELQFGNTTFSGSSQELPVKVTNTERILGMEYTVPDIRPEVTTSVMTYYETTSASDSDEENDLKSKITEKAQGIKDLVSKKRMGLPRVQSERILRLADEIMKAQSRSADTVSATFEKLSSSLSTPRAITERKLTQQDSTNRRAKSIIEIAAQSESILQKFSKTKEYPSSISNGDAAEHLTKMIRKLHCRHRKLKKFAEEIIAKRWKLLNLSSLKLHGTIIRQSPEKASQKTNKNAGSENSKRLLDSKSKKTEVKTLYTNPTVMLKEVSIRTGRELLSESDPLWKAINKVGVERSEKCRKSQYVQTKHFDEGGLASSSDQIIRPPKKHRRRLRFNPANTRYSTLESKQRRTGGAAASTKSILPLLKMSALKVFMYNFHKMSVTPTKLHIPTMGPNGKSVYDVDGAKLTNEFVNQWKRRSYTIGIMAVVLSALLQCIYLCAPRMGDNFVTYTMVDALGSKQMSWLTPTGIYGLIFVGYLLGGMSVVKTASAVAHNETVREYCKSRRKKLYLWYGLAIYFFMVWIVRTGMWYVRMDATEEEMQNIFGTKFYYTQLPARMLYTQFLFECCGAHGPEDYPQGAVIGWPKTCYANVKTYDEYYTAVPEPFEFGCSMKVHKYSSIAMGIICGLCLLILILVISYPVYLYVYELFLCMWTHELDPWLENVKDEKETRQQVHVVGSK